MSTRPITPRKPALRAFTGLVGLPPEPEAIQKRGPGRPPKHAVAMTDAERARYKRARHKANKEDQERRDLIAKLMKIWKRQQSRIVIDARKNPNAWEDAHEAAAHHKREYLGELLRMPVAELKQALSVQKETVDTHGRLHNERSGELSSKGGQSEIETLLAAQNIVHTNMADQTAEEDLQKTLAASNAQVSTDVDTRVPSLIEASLADRLLQKAVDHIISNMRRCPDGGAKCAMCDEPFLSEQAAENHLWEQYRKGEKQAETSALFEQVGIAVQGVTTAERHYNRITLEVTVVRAMLGKSHQQIERRISNFVTRPKFRS